MPAKEKKAQPVKEEGVAYVTAYGTYYDKPKVDADKIRDCLRNNYLADKVDKLRSLIFTEKFAIEVKDANGDPDEDLQKRLMAMCEQNDVRIWARMQQAWVDGFGWGPALFNPVWDWLDGPNGKEYWLQKLRRLPPESFKEQPPGKRNACSEILPGIVLSDDMSSVEFWQAPVAGMTGTTQLKNVFMVRDPTSTELAGTSKIIPLVPLITMLNFCWQAQMQKVNRVGAPTIFIKVTNPVVNKATKRDDIAYANTILLNWGKGTAYQLRENMEVVNLEVKESEVALSTIELIRQRIDDYVTPATLIRKEGQGIGGNATADKELVDTWVVGQHQWVEDQFEPLLQTYLDANGYEGYSVQIYIGARGAALGYLQAEQAKVGFQTRVASVNEIREMIGLSPLSDEEITKIVDEWGKIIPAPASTPFGFTAMDPCGYKEHAPTEAERALEEKLHAIYGSAAKKVIAALRSERT